MAQNYDTLTNSLIYDVVKRTNGKRKEIHRILCSLADIEPYQVNQCSLANKAKLVVKEIKRLKNARNESIYQNYLEKKFIFPPLKEKQNGSIQPTTETSAQNQAISNLQKTNMTLQRMVVNLNMQITKLRRKVKEVNVASLKLKLKRQENAIYKLKSKNRHLEKGKKEGKQDPLQFDKSSQCKLNMDDMKTLQEKILYLENENVTLQDEKSSTDRESPMDEEVFRMRENTKGLPYSSKLRSVYYKFRSCDVGINHISSLIKSVLDIVGIHIPLKDFPGESVIASFTSEMGFIAREQLCEKLSASDCVTMHRDATTKKGKHFYGVQLSTKDETLTAGIREVVDGKAATYIDCTNQMCSDIDSHMESESSMNYVTSYMTDRSATETKVNILLKDVNNNNEVPSFKCAVHPLLQFSDVCLKEIKELEKKLGVHEKSYIGCQKGESVTQCLLRFVSKLFYKDGSGDPLMAALYLKDLGMKIPILNFRGNRFNVLFYNAAGTFYLSQHLQDYLESSKSTLNFVQTCILEGLKDPILMDICKCLGILSKLITEPYWRKAGGEVASAIEMGPVYTRLIECLGIGCETPLTLLHNNIQLFPGPSVEPDDVLQLLFNSHVSSNAVTIMTSLCKAMRDKAQHLFKDFLPSGPFFSPSVSEIASFSSCPPNNICVERLMGKLDSKLKFAPNMNTDNIESSVMYKSNKTSDWLNDKPEIVQKKIICTARKHKTDICSKTKERKHHLKQQQLQIIKERKESVLKKRKKVDKQKEELIENLDTLGLWDSDDKIENGIKEIKTNKEQLSLLKKQIGMIRQLYNIDQKHKHLLQYSKKGKAFSVDQIKQNLKELIKVKITKNEVQLVEPNVVGKKIKHIWSDDNGNTVWNGRILSNDNGVFKVRFNFDPMTHTLALLSNTSAC
ncbi:uncharacterized protein LOC110441045 [Mizuhopecten yessoensis]|uniref:uncharacterized protein LOC110441045 n=1 Tax=Mizuhopecten yessoensis TaxID=6573 RepID=UPI000B45B671|nr:uncharacterized protein LOC110441045 [Mizuhopecten yessoensis]